MVLEGSLACRPFRPAASERYPDPAFPSRANYLTDSEPQIARLSLWVDPPATRFVHRYYFPFVDV